MTDPSPQKLDNEESPTGGVKDMENKALDEQSTGDESQNAKSWESTQDDKGIRFNINKLPTLVIKLDKIKVHKTETVTVMQEMMDKFPPIGYQHVVDYDSDATVDYYPIIENKPTKAVEILLDKGKESLSKLHKRLIQAYPSKCGFAISIHGIKRRKSRTFLGCKVQGCKSRFSKVRDWNSHHRRIHTGICLECDTCKKTFKTPSFFMGSLICTSGYMVCG